MVKDTPVIYRYHFNFLDNRVVIIELKLQPDSLDYINQGEFTPPDWARLDFMPCQYCSITNKDSKYCPVAANIANVVKDIEGINPEDIVDVQVDTEQRVYSEKRISISRALSSLMGIIMVTSGCEELDKLRPMVRYHLPFATRHETVYRAVSMYLLAQYFRYKNGQEPDWGLNGLINLYHKITNINANTYKRLEKAANLAVCVNAVSVLDTFAQTAIKEKMKELKDLFSPYLDT